MKSIEQILDDMTLTEDEYNFKELQKYGDVVRFGGDEFILIAYDKSALYLNYKQNLDFTIAVVHKPKNKTIAEVQNEADRQMLLKKAVSKNANTSRE